MIQGTQAITRNWGGSGRDFLRAVYNFLTGIRIGEVNIDPANILANTTAETAAIALPAGTAAVGDYVEVTPPAAFNHGLIVQSARIAVADQLTVRISNLTAGAIDPAAGAWTYYIQKATALRPVAG